MAEIKSEHIWNLTLIFVEEFGLYYKGDFLLNAQCEKLPAWKWITGETFRDLDSYPLSNNDTKMYARMLLSGEGIISVEGSLSDCSGDKECRHGYVCEHEEVLRCKSESHNEIVFGGTCYVFYHDELLNWFEAYNECERDNGRLVTFRNLKKNEPQIAVQLNHRRKYWIELNRYEWRWIDSGKLISYTNFETFPRKDDSCLAVNIRSRKLGSLRYCSLELYKFICIKDTTNCARNPCRNGETSSESDLIVFVIVAVVIVLIVLTVLPVVICTRKYKNKQRISNDAGLSSKYEIMDTSASIHPHAMAMDDNIGPGGSQPSGHGNAVYGQVVSPENGDYNGHPEISNSLVYADLEFVTKNQKTLNTQTYSNQGQQKKAQNVCTGPMGDVYSMVQKKIAVMKHIGCRTIMNSRAIGKLRTHPLHATYTCIECERNDNTIAVSIANGVRDQPIVIVEHSISTSVLLYKIYSYECFGIIK